MKTLALFSCLSLPLTTPALQAQWYYHETDSPWSWAATPGDWIYQPDTPLLAWSNSLQSWIPNPFSMPGPDVAPVFDTTALRLEFYQDPLDALPWLSLTLNYSGRETGDVQFFDNAPFEAHYAYTLNHARSEATIFAHYYDTTTEVMHSFSVTLDFSDEYTGSYSLMGELGTSACVVCVHTGTFIAALPE
ncbi:MAG: hypothetical protein E1N59_449 [Puniceicoccaceae bacterium 5H]|nr:MAG: hypothetical protein E1N59_449 [Puniceicoccaceae bacterium 5H]